MRKINSRICAGLLVLTMALPLASCFGGNEEQTSESTADVSTTAPAGHTDRTKLLTTAEFRQNGTDLTCSVKSMEKTFDFVDRITVSKKSSWILSSDAEGTKEIPSKTVELKEGENTYYVTVTYREEKAVYRATVNYTQTATVTFYANTEKGIPAQQIKPGESVTRPADPVREGYTFLGWFKDGNAYQFNTAVTADTVLIAHWSKNPGPAWVYSDEAPHFTDTSAAINVVWKDYANTSGIRPASVVCVLTETDGTTEKSYPVIVSEKDVKWEGQAPAGAILSQGAGNWTVKITGLSNGKNYTFRQTALTSDYSTQQAGTSAVNTIAGYVPSVDKTAALTARNGRLYDAAGNVITLQGAVTWNVNVQGFDTSLSSSSLEKFKNIGVNCIRLTVQLVGNSGIGYVYKTNGSSRTGDYNDSNAERTTANYQEKILSALDTAIQNAADLGIYSIIDWGILTSDPNQYTPEASQFFKAVATKYASNPYVLYEICNEPEVSDANGAWATVKSYGEEIIRVIRNAGSDGVIIQAANHVTTHISNKDGKDPIHDPFDDETAYNVAYSFHCYPGNYVYENFTYTYGWRLQDAYEAGLTVIVTEFSPMDGTFGDADPLSFDMNETEKYVRLFREYDIGYCFFRCASPSSDSAKYNENYMFVPFVDLGVRDWTVDDMTECGKYFYRLLTGDGVMAAPDYTTTSMKIYRSSYSDNFADYGLIKVLPGFATRADGIANGYFYYTGASNDLSEKLYTEYCRILYEKVVKTMDDSTRVRVQGSTAEYTASMLPGTKEAAMKLTYKYGGADYNLSVSYGANPAGTGYGLTVTVFKK